MNEPARKLGCTFEEYVAYDEASEGKHAFLEGEIFAMAGGTEAHSLLTLAMGSLLREALRDRPCRVYSPDMRLLVKETGLATYPDAAVVCGKTDFLTPAKTTYTNPIVLVEVLSPSTEKYDQIVKMNHYFHIPTLREYVMVWQDKRLIFLYTPSGDGNWLLRIVQAGQELKLPSIDVTLSLDDIYRGVFDD